MPLMSRVFFNNSLLRFVSFSVIIVLDPFSLRLILKMSFLGPYEVNWTMIGRGFLVVSSCIWPSR